MNVLELERAQVTYGIGNPLELRELPDGAYKTDEYMRGRDLFHAGKTPIVDAAFIQIMGLEGGIREVEGKKVPYEVANLSRDLVWDGETPIEEFGVALVAELAGMPIEAHFSGHQFDVYIDDIDGSLTPEQLVGRLIYSPTKIYEKHMAHLLPDAQRDVINFERDFLTAPYAKGHKFMDIFEGKASGQIRAFQEGTGRGFVWGYRKTEEDELSGIDMNGKPQTVTELANSDQTDEDMRDSLLKDQEFFKGIEKHRRWIIRFTFDETRTCCIYATAAQSSTKLYSSADLEEINKDVSYFKSTGLPILFSGFSGIYLPSSHKESKVCSSCKKEKSSSDEAKKCSCAKESN